MVYTSYIPSGGTTNGESDSFEIAGISGNPTQVGDYVLTLSATGPGGTSTKTFPLKIRVGNAQPLPNQTLTATAGQPFSATLAVADPVNAPFGTYKVHTYPNDGKEYPDFTGSGDYWIYGGPSPYIFPPLSLPPGLSIGSRIEQIDQGAQITGTPVFSGEFSTEIAIAYSNVNAAGYLGDSPKSSSTTLSINIAAGATSALYPLPPSLTGGEAISLTPAWNATGAVWSATGLPAGLTINSLTGEITGAISTKGTFSVTVSVVYNGNAYAENLVLQVAPAAPVLKPDQTISLIYGESVVRNLRNLLEDPLEAYSDWSSWTVAELPSWAIFDLSNGAYIGTPGFPYGTAQSPTPPPERGTWVVPVTVSGAGGSDSGLFTLVVGFGPPVITSGQEFDLNYQQAFSGQLSLEDTSNRPFNGFRVSTSSPLPPGLSVNSSGTITGTPTAAGEFTTLISPLGTGFTSPGSLNNVDYEMVVFRVAFGVPIITSSQTGSGKVGEAFSKTFSLTDSANRPVTSWSATGLPSWATLNTTTGAITGTPQDTGSTTITLTATGPGGADTETATISIAIGVPLISAGQTFAGKVGDAFSANISLDDALDRPATAWAATGLPAGLSINSSTGAITGAPTTIGSFTASIAASNGAGSGAAQSVGFSIEAGTPIITSGQSLGGKVGEEFNRTLAIFDSTNRPVTSWSISGLPSWATLNTSTGAITGAPQDAESVSILATATGSGGTSEPTTATIVVALGAPIIDPATFSGKVGEVFSATPTLSDALDRPASSWSATGLPAGLSINAATGAITGTPSNLGTFTATLRATGAGGTSDPTSVEFTIAAGAPIIPSGQFFAATQNSAFIFSVSLTDATNRPATTWAASSLPSWASFNTSTGTLSGTPTNLSPASINVTATGPGGTSLTEAVVVTVSAGSTGGNGGTPNTTMQLVQSQSFTANVGESFTATPQVLSGEPVTWYASELPDWATINSSTGAITGTPTFTGEHYITITAVDENGLTATAVVTLTTVSWNTLELFIDPKNRKMLSKANTRSVLSKMMLKRDDRTPFTIVFVTGTTSFSVPSDYAISIGIKQNYGGEYLAYADAASGILDLTTAPVQALFENDQELVDALFEVKWEDTAQAAIRTITVPLQIQNAVNLSGGGGTVGGPSVSSSLDRYISYRQKILTASSAPSTTLTISETISDPAMFHRPSTATFPAKRGWLSAVSSVTLDGSALVAEEDFVFYPDRQCFYFLDPDTTGDIVITGSATRNFVNFGVTIEKSVSAASSTSTSIDTDSPDFQITSVSITSEDMGTETPSAFYFDAATATLFLETSFTADAGKAFLLTESGDEIEFDLPALADASRVTVPKSLNATSVNQVILPAAQIGGVEVGDFTPFAVLEKTQSGDDILHLGWNYPTGYEKGQFTVEATNGAESYTFTFPYWPGNAFELPRSLDNVHSLSGATESLVVFDATAQKLIFCKSQSGQLSYTATHKAYEGLAAGGEELEIVAEIPGVYATTAGTGHHLSTLRTLSPSQDWFAWWYQEYGIYFVQIVDEKNVVIYQDDSQGAFANSRSGYTAEELLPLTLKLPFAPLWSLSRRDDTSLFQAAFAPDFVPTAFSSATLPELDDTQRYAADTMAAGKSVTLSTNKSIPVRGVQGVNFTGPKPTYYAGATIPYLVLATYKWFVVKCTNRNGNSLLTDGKKYLLCVNNTHFDNRSIMVNITNEGSNIAADLYEMKEGN